jgi:shikimate kinase
MVDIFRPLKDKLFAQFGELIIADLKQEFITTLNFDKFEIVNREIIRFFESIPHLSEKVLVRISKLVVTYADLITDKRKNVKDEEKRFVAYKLFEYRNKFYAFLKNIILDGTKKEKESCIENIFTLSNALGKLLSGFHMYE